MIFFNRQNRIRAWGLACVMIVFFFISSLAYSAGGEHAAGDHAGHDSAAVTEGNAHGEGGHGAHDSGKKMED